ncbi:hypothetical protein ACHAWC_011077 [Mediolabrus comicus]
MGTEGGVMDLPGLHRLGQRWNEQGQGYITCSQRHHYYLVFFFSFLNGELLSTREKDCCSE